MRPHIQRSLGALAAILLTFSAAYADTDADAKAGPRDRPRQRVVPHELPEHREPLDSFALIQALNADLLSHDSATQTLERWCATRHLASPAKVVAERDRTISKPVTAEQRQTLKVSDKEPVQYRRVRLRCGGHVLSEADNWYVPSRLTAAMNQQLETTDTPFGRVVQPLKFQRHTLNSKVLWSPPPAEERSAPRDIPREVLQHRAVLTLPDGTPFSMVTETYTREVLGYAPLANNEPGFAEVMLAYHSFRNENITSRPSRSALSGS